MIEWSEINSLQDKKRNLQLQLSDLLNTPNASIDDINAIKSEILYLDKQIVNILGNNELKRLEELKGKRNSQEQRSIKMYYALKDRYKKISKMNIAVKKISAVIDSKFNTNNDLDYYVERVKVK